MQEFNEETLIQELEGLQDPQELVAYAKAHKEVLVFLVDALSDAKRRVRQSAALVLRHLAYSEAQSLEPLIHELIDALYRPEAQTRWEILSLLSLLDIRSPEALDSSFEAALEALYDEESGLVRLAAFQYLLHLIKLKPDWLGKLWPYIDEAIQCYHGDNQFQEMLNSLSSALAQGCFDKDHKELLVERLSFDAEQGRGAIKRMCKHLIEQAQA